MDTDIDYIHYDLDLQDMTLVQDHDAPLGPEE